MNGEHAPILSKQTLVPVGLVVAAAAGAVATVLWFQGVVKTAVEERAVDSQKSVEKLKESIEGLRGVVADNREALIEINANLRHALPSDEKIRMMIQESAPFSREKALWESRFDGLERRITDLENP